MLGYKGGVIDGHCFLSHDGVLSDNMVGALLGNVGFDFGLF